MRRVAAVGGYPSEFFPDAESFLAACTEPRPGCLLLDVDMPGMSGLELQRELNQRQVCLPVVLVTGHDDVPTVLAAMKAQALDVLHKPFQNAELLARIQHAMQVDASRRAAIELRFQAQRRYSSLNAREIEVMQRVVEGCANKQIAHQLDLSIKTVEAYRSGIMKKMQAESLPELVRLALALRPEEAVISA